MKRVVLRQLYRELTLNCREPRQIMYACLFFIVMLVFFPLTISADSNTLRGMAPGIIWIDILFAFFLSSDRLFQQDYEDGVIEQWLVSGYSVSVIVATKLFMHWCLNSIPLLVICPLIGVFFHFNEYETIILMFSLLCGTPAIVSLCALAAVFSAGLKREGILMALIVFPLTIPILIFGSSSLSAALQGLPIQGYLAVLLAFSTITMGFLPIAIGAVIRLNLAE